MMDRIIFGNKKITMVDSLLDILIPIDKTKVISPIDDKYLTWPGKDQGKPKPPIIWLDD